jgi:hypothetical protein
LLSAVSFWKSRGDPVELPLLLFFAECLNLRQLSLEKAVDKAAIDAIKGYVAAPSVSLQRLHLYINSNAVPPLAATPPRIRRLSLEVQDCETCRHLVMPALATLRTLHSLRLKFSFRSWLRSDELLELRSLTALRSLRLLARPDKLLSRMLEDSHNGDVTAAIGQDLRELELMISARRLTVGVLRFIGEYCPSLRTLALYGRFA